MHKTKIISLILALIMSLSCLAGCSSDYPVVDRTLDLDEFLNRCFEGTGMSISPDNTSVTVSAVADRMNIDYAASDDAVKSINSAIRNATLSTNELTGVWKGKINIGPVIADNFKTLTEVNVADYFTELYIPCELALTPEGVYMLKFTEDDISRARSKIINSGTKAAKSYLSESSGASLLIGIGADKIITSVLEYVVNIVEQMLRNGCAGYYSVVRKTITFDSELVYDFAVAGQNMTLTGPSGGTLASNLAGIYTRVNLTEDFESESNG